MEPDEKLNLITRLKKSPRWLKITTVLLLILIMGVGGYAQVIKNKPLVVPIHTITKQDIEKTVVANGRLKAVNEQIFFTPVDSTLMELNVEVGDQVKKGDILGRLDTLELERRYQNALANQAAKEAELARALASSDELTFKAAQAEYLKAKNNFDRVDKLYQAGAASLVELEVAQTELTRIESSYYEARVKAEQKAAERLSSSLQAQVDLARQEVAQAKERVDLATFIANHDGVITLVGAKRGNQVREGTELLILSDDSNLEINANVNEIDAGHLKIGQEADIRCMALFAEKYKGEITRIGKAAILEKGAAGDNVNIPVTVKLEGDITGLKIGYTTDMTIKMVMEKNVIVAPLESVINQEGGTIVYVVKDGQVQERVVTTKAGNELYEVIVSGLEEGEQIVSNPSPTMKAGQKVVVPPEAGNND